MQNISTKKTNTLAENTTYTHKRARTHTHTNTDHCAEIKLQNEHWAVKLLNSCKTENNFNFTLHLSLSIWMSFALSIITYDYSQ